MKKTAFEITLFDYDDGNSVLQIVNKQTGEVYEKRADYALPMLHVFKSIDYAMEEGEPFEVEPTQLLFAIECRYYNKGYNDAKEVIERFKP